jgi:hypothetical protein
MNEKDGHQVIGCHVSSCKFFNNNLCQLSGIEVGAYHNVSSGVAEDETLCASYEKRADDISNFRAAEYNNVYD